MVSLSLFYMWPPQDVQNMHYPYLFIRSLQTQKEYIAFVLKDTQTDLDSLYTL